MTALDPSHLPFLSHTDDPTTGQATITSVSPLHPPPSSSSQSKEGPSWRGAWKRRQESKASAHQHHEGGSLLDEHHERQEARKEATRRRGRVPVSAIPDMRFEQSLLAALRPWIHPASSSSPKREEGKVTLGEKHPRGRRGEPGLDEEKQEIVGAEEKVALVSTDLTSVEDGSQSPKASLLGPVTLEYRMISWLLLRDQIIFPLLQGFGWGVAGFAFAAVWNWNRQRVEIKSTAGTSSLSNLAKRARLSSSR